MQAVDPKDRPFRPAEPTKSAQPGGHLSRATHVIIARSGYTGLNTALEAARASHSTLAPDAQTSGWGCSTTNQKQFSASITSMAEEPSGKPKSGAPVLWQQAMASVFLRCLATLA